LGGLVEPINNMNDVTQPTSQDSSVPQREMTFGEKLVGLNFNPSNDDKVSKAKKLCADLADLLHEDQRSSETSELKNILLPATYAEILNAQMNVVKVLTLKY
jgi:hypothetical protein